MAAVLPYQNFLTSETTINEQPFTIRTNIDGGLPKVRRRFSYVIETISTALVLTKTELDNLLDFYRFYDRFNESGFMIIPGHDGEMVKRVNNL